MNQPLHLIRLLSYTVGCKSIYILGISLILQPYNLNLKWTFTLITLEEWTHSTYARKVKLNENANLCQIKLKSDVCMCIHLTVHSLVHQMFASFFMGYICVQRSLNQTKDSLLD